MSIVSHHGGDRMKERMGLNKRSMQRMAKKALEEGFSPRETTGALRRYLDYKRFKNGCDVRVHGNYVFVFGENDVLVTVFHLPKRLIRAVDQLRRRCDEQGIRDDLGGRLPQGEEGQDA